MQEEESNPSIGRGLFRVGTLFCALALVVWFFWEMYSESAALIRLSATAKNFPYVERCDAEGNPVATGQPNCVDIGRYLFINGPVLKALRRDCSDRSRPPVMLILEAGKASRKEIVGVQKSLSFLKRNGVVPC
jgi:hypothetical protein